MAKKRRHERLKPWCWYCDREFENDNVLIQHQRMKHFKCGQCHRKLNSASGLVIHMAQMHKETMDRVPNAIDGHDSPELEIFGMDGIPQEDLQRHIDGLPIAPYNRTKLIIGDSSILPILAAQKASVAAQMAESKNMTVLGGGPVIPPLAAATGSAPSMTGPVGVVRDAVGPSPNLAGQAVSPPLAGGHHPSPPLAGGYHPSYYPYGGYPQYPPQYAAAYAQQYQQYYAQQYQYAMAAYSTGYPPSMPQAMPAVSRVDGVDEAGVPRLGEKRVLQNDVVASTDQDTEEARETSECSDAGLERDAGGPLIIPATIDAQTNRVIPGAVFVVSSLERSVEEMRSALRKYQCRV